MDFIISLAHFCERCGPTSTICTQITPSTCATSHPCVTPPADDPPQLSNSYSKWSDTSSPSKTHDRMSGFSTPSETPPLSPRSPGTRHNPYFPNLSTDNKSIRSFGDGLDNDGEGCDNCQFLVPERIRARLPEGAPGSPCKDGKRRNGSPVLRSSESVLARGPAGCEDGCDSDDGPCKSYVSGSSSSSSLPCTSPSSPLSLPRNAHAHTLTYISTRQPISPAAYSLLRRSIIRTLSCEQLPKSSRSGSLYFGDPSSGYTIAYVFRLPDPLARGHFRTYALIALGGRDSWRVSMAMVKVLEHFENIASQIVAMADRVLERESSPMYSRPTTAIQHPASPTLGTAASSLPTPAATPQHRAQNRAVAGLAQNTRTITPVSSFLTAKKVDPDGYPRVSREVTKDKGLAELVGKPDFFVDLHARFVMLLSGLVKEFGGVSC